MRNGFVLSLIMALIVAIFAIQNAAAIPIKILFWQVNLSLAIIILVSVIIGAVITGIMSIKKEMAIKKQNKELLNKMKELEKNNTDLMENLDQKDKSYIKDSQYKEVSKNNKSEK
ncbi:LapA family protein [Clostridium botulinum]|nr:LapA family protein [Clostridium botulinum]